MGVLRVGIAMGIAVGVVAVGLTGCANAPRAIVVSVAPRRVDAEGPAPSATDIAIAKKVSADELYTVYSQNLMLGANPDQRFLHRWLLVSGVFQDVSRSLVPQVYLELRTHDPEGFVYAALSSQASSLLTTLRPGMSVHLLCRGDGMMIGSPVVRECRPA